MFMELIRNYGKDDVDICEIYKNGTHGLSVSKSTGNIIISGDSADTFRVFTKILLFQN